MKGETDCRDNWSRHCLKDTIKIDFGVKMFPKENQILPMEKARSF